MKKSAKILTLVLALVMLFSILAVVAVPASAATISTGTKVYLNAGGSSYWDQGGAWFSAYFMDANKKTCQFVTMTKDSDSGYYVAEAPSGTWTYVIFVRNNPTDKVADWTNVWNQTADLAIQSGKNLYKITGWGSSSNGNKSTGSWSNYTPACTNHNYDAYGKCTNSGCTAGHTYTVAGCIMVNGVETLTTVFGTSWDAANTANDMLYDSVSKTYTKVYEKVPAGTYAFKCTEDHAWGNAYPSSNYSLTVAYDNSTVTITLKDGVVSATAEHVHTWTDADCDTPKTCSICGETDGEALGHDYSAVVTAPTCEKDGYTTYTCACGDSYVDDEVEANGHNYVDGACTVCGGADPDYCEHEYMYDCDKACMHCYNVTREDAEHNIVHVDAKAPTCNENGNVEYWYCSICGYAWTDAEQTQVANRYNVILPAAHSYTYVCDAHCNVCYELTNEDAAHELVHVDAVAPTCTAGGNVEHWYCKHCGATWTDAEMTQVTNQMSVKLGATGHTYTNGYCTCGDFDLNDTVTIYFENNWKWTNIHVYYWYGKADTPNAGWPGVSVGTPIGKNGSGENDIYAITIPKYATGIIFNGKDNGNDKQTKDIKSGWANCVCFYMDWTEAEGEHVDTYEFHKNETVTNDPTCLEPGSKVTTCSVCGASSSEELAPVHANLVHVEASAKTCTEDGNLEHWYCSECGYAYLDADCKLNTNLLSVKLPATGHVWNNAECDNCDAALPVLGTTDSFDLTTEAGFNAATESGKLAFVGYFRNNGDSHQFGTGANIQFVVPANTTVTLIGHSAQYGVFNVYVNGVEYKMEEALSVTVLEESVVVIAVGDNGASYSYLKSIELKEYVDRTIYEDTTITFGSEGNYKNSVVDFSGIQIGDNGGNNSQVKNGSFDLVLKAGAQVTIHGYSNYTSYKLNGGAEITDEYYTFVANMDTVLTVTPVSGNNYFYSIEITYHTHNATHVAESCYNVEYWFCEGCETYWANADLTQITNSHNVIKAEATHDLVHVAESCYNVEHWYCEACETVWADEALTQITNHRNVIKAEATHNLVHVPESCYNVEHWYCEACETVWANEALTQITNHRNVIKAEATHDLVHVEAKAPTCYENGNIEYWYCEACETVWANEALTQITNRLSVVLPMAHKPATHVEAVAPTCTTLGNIEFWYCEECGQAWLDAACTLNTNLMAVRLPMGDHNYVNGTCTGCGDIKSVFVESAEDLKNALTGDMDVTLGADLDLTGEFLQVDGAIKLDLNGHTLTVSGLVFFDDSGMIVDNGDTKGLVIVAKDRIVANQVKSDVLPIWNGEGYMFSTVKDQHRPVSTTNTGFVVEFRPSVAEGDLKNTIFADGAADNALTFKVRIRCYDENGNVVATFDYAVSEEVVKSVYTNGTTIRFTLKGAGSAYANYGISFVVESDCGILYDEVVGNFANGELTFSK